MQRAVLVLIGVEEDFRGEPPQTIECFESGLLEREGH